MQDSNPKPRMPIRRFDVFAEYQRLKGLEEGLDEAHAEGYGVWVAKVVASGGGRRAGATKAAPAGRREADEREEQPEAQGWRTLGDEPQTDETFQHEIVRRMGPDFYIRVFTPAIAESFQQGKHYEEIRDAVRKDWSPRR